MILGMKKNLGPVPQHIADRILIRFLTNGLSRQTPLALGKMSNTKRPVAMEPYHRHIVELCEKNKIRFDEIILPEHIRDEFERGGADNGIWGRASENKNGSKEILVSFISSMKEYAAALHEIGHHMDQHQIRENELHKLSPSFIKAALKDEFKKEFPDGKPEMIEFLLWGREKVIHLMHKSNELGAWAWARQNAKIWTNEMEEFSHKMLATYLKEIYK